MRSLMLRGAQILRPGGLSYPLDALAASIRAAYGLRRLRSGWTGPLVTVRRSSDNATMDVSAGADGWLDTAALLAFCGSASGYVTKWWDQSGNGFHAVQGNAGAQPRIVNAGVVETLGGRPALYAYLYGMTTTIPQISQPFSVVITLSPNISADQVIMRGGSAGAAPYIYSGGGSRLYAGSFLAGGAVVSGNNYYFDYVFNGTNSRVGINGVPTYGSGGSNAMLANPSILANESSSQPVIGRVGEMIVLSRGTTPEELSYIGKIIGGQRGIVVS